MNRMNKLLTSFALFTLGSSVWAGGHYVPGVEGIQAATVPPPGTYYLGYFVHYSIDELKIPATSKKMPGSNTGTVNALANRFVHITQHKILGADYGVEAIVPVIRKSLTFSSAGISESNTGLGDVYLGPLVLGWHGTNWDAVAAAGLWFDSADDNRFSDPGMGYKSVMLTLGGTYYFDSAKTWSFSALMRYELNTKNNGFEPGDQLTLEWGLGKVLEGTRLQLGLVGYYQGQTTKDRGIGASNHKYARSAFGLQADYNLLKDAGVLLRAAYYKEVSADAGSAPQAKGNTFRFTLVKAF